MGVLTKEQIGIEAPFGSAEALTYLAEMTAQGRGLRQGDRRRARSGCAPSTATRSCR